ncbi:unnamed protein product [Lepidochelys kempii]
MGPGRDRGRVPASVGSAAGHTEPIGESCMSHPPSGCRSEPLPSLAGSKVKRGAGCQDSWVLSYDPGTSVISIPSSGRGGSRPAECSEQGSPGSPNSWVPSPRAVAGLVTAMLRASVSPISHSYILGAGEGQMSPVSVKHSKTPNKGHSLLPGTGVGAGDPGGGLRLLHTRAGAEETRILWGLAVLQTSSRAPPAGSTMDQGSFCSSKAPGCWDLCPTAPAPHS